MSSKNTPMFGGVLVDGQEFRMVPAGDAGAFRCALCAFSFEAGFSRCPDDACCSVDGRKFYFIDSKKQTI